MVGHGEVVPARTSPTLHPPSHPIIIVATSTARVKYFPADKLSLDMQMPGNAQKQKPTPGLLSSVVQFSAQTSAARTQLALTHRLIKKGRDTLGAPKGKRVVVFVDDLNMPAPEEYGAQPPLELLRQFLDLGGFYDTHKLQWKVSEQ